MGYRLMWETNSITYYMKALQDRGAARLWGELSGGQPPLSEGLLVLSVCQQDCEPILGPRRATALLSSRF